MTRLWRAWALAVVFRLGAGTILMLSSQDARADVAAPVQVATMRAEGGNGYEWSTYSVRYRLLACKGSFFIAYELIKGSHAFSNTFILDGRRIDVSSMSPPTPSSGRFEGRVVRRNDGTTVGTFVASATDALGMGCFSGDIVEFAKVRDVLGEKGNEQEQKALLDRLTIETNTVPADRNEGMVQRLHSLELSEKNKAAAAEREAKKEAAKKEAEANKGAAVPPSDGSAPDSTPSHDVPSPGSPAQGSRTHSESTTPSGDSTPADEPAPEVDYVERRREQQRTRAESDASAQEQVRTYQQFFQDMQAIGQARAEERERDEARAERKAAIAAEEYRAMRTDECAKVLPFELDPTAHLPPGKSFTDDSRECRNGAYQGWHSESQDVYTFSLSSPQELRFVLAGDLPSSSLSLHQGDATTSLQEGTDFKQKLGPGSYSVTVTRQHAAEETPDAAKAPYYLRVMKSDMCWTTEALALRDGVTCFQPKTSTCRGPDGEPAVMYRLDPTTQNRRNISFNLRGGEPVLILLAGSQTRLVRVDYRAAGGSLAAVMANARDESIYALVASGSRDSATPMTLEVRSKVLPFVREFIPLWNMGGGGAFTTDGDFAAMVNLGFSLGAQVHRIVGVSGVVQGAIGAGSRRSELAPLGWALFGVGVHLGSSRDFVRLTPGAQLVRWGEADTGPPYVDKESLGVGPAARLDLLLSSTRVPFGFAPYIQAARVSGQSLIAIGITAAVTRGQPGPEPSDE